MPRSQAETNAMARKRVRVLEAKQQAWGLAHLFDPTVDLTNDNPFNCGIRNCKGLGLFQHLCRVHYEQLRTGRVIKPKFVLPYADYDEIRRLYVDERWTIEAIGSKFGCSGKPITTCLLRMDVQIRPPGDKEPAACGTVSGYHRHLREEGSPVTCVPCLEASRADKKKWRQPHLDRLSAEARARRAPHLEELAAKARDQYAQKKLTLPPVPVCKFCGHPLRRDNKRGICNRPECIEERRPVCVVCTMKFFSHGGKNSVLCPECQVNYGRCWRCEQILPRTQMRSQWECNNCRNEIRRNLAHRNGVSPSEPAKCGTGSGYNAHLRHGEEPCNPCRAQYNRDQSEYRARKRAGTVGMWRLDLNIAKIIKLSDAGWSVAEIAEKLGCSSATIYRRLTGQKKNAAGGQASTLS